MILEWYGYQKSYSSHINMSSTSTINQLWMIKSLMTFATLWILPTLVLRYNCLKRLKHQSGESFVCPTKRNDIEISLCRPTSTHHIK